MLRKYMMITLVCCTWTAALAASALKDTMQNWRAHEKATAAMVDGHTAIDDKAVRAMLTDFVSGAGALEARIKGTSAAATDMKARFASFRSDSEAALVGISDKPALSRNLGKLFNECKACHDLYKE